jgi:D-beta-D-heptose 7-phosphate kinase / D-beta-D-heptose 1-phosphate adenosyltransferase
MEIHTGYALDSRVAATIPRDGFADRKILVIGDLMLDRYILGDVTRISPEAPVPVLSVRGDRSVAGGAANVVLNVAGLNAKALVAGVVGDDPAGARLKEILASTNVSTHAVVIDSQRATTCKTRVMCDNHQIVRLDEESSLPVADNISSQLFDKVVTLLDEKVDAVILSDYAKGVFSAAFTKSVIKECSSRDIPTLVDPKRADYSPYAGATCVTPNLKEFKMALSAMSIADEELSLAGPSLRKRLDSKALLITQGAHGMTLVTAEHSHHFPALVEEVFDVSGAGDTVIATVAVGLAAGLDLVSAVKLSNFAASVVVRRAGTTPIHWDDLRSVIFQDKQSSDQAHVRQTAGQAANTNKQFYSVG